MFGFVIVFMFWMDGVHMIDTSFENLNVIGQGIRGIKSIQNE
jgi:hypothetical protein